VSALFIRVTLRLEQSERSEQPQNDVGRGVKQACSACGPCDQAHHHRANGDGCVRSPESSHLQGGEAGKWHSAVRRHSDPYRLPPVQRQELPQEGLGRRGCTAQSLGWGDIVPWMNGGAGAGK